MTRRPDCHPDRRHVARGMCNACYRRDLEARHGPCTVEGCPNYIKSRGVCAAHYDRLRRHGDVHADVPLRPGNKLRTQPCGTLAAYRRGCHCDECRAANAEHKRREYRRRTVPATPFIARLQALVDAGVTRYQIAQRAGLPYPTVKDLLAKDRQRLLRPTAAKLIAAFRQPHRVHRRQPGPVCIDCGGDPMPGGTIRCLDCFHAWQRRRSAP